MLLSLVLYTRSGGLQNTTNDCDKVLLVLDPEHIQDVATQVDLASS